MPCVIPLAPSPLASPVELRWSKPRLARLAFLVGLGWEADAVARDPLVASTKACVFKQAQRYGLAFREAANLRLPPRTLSRFDVAADKRGLGRDALMRAVLVAAASDVSLIDNILDDGA